MKELSAKTVQNKFDLLAWEKALKCVLYGIISYRFFEVVQYVFYRFSLDIAPIKVVNYILIMGSLFCVMKGLKDIRGGNGLLRAGFVIGVLLFIASAVTEGIYIFTSWKWESGSILFPNNTYDVKSNLFVVEERVALVASVVSIFVILLGILSTQEEITIKKYILTGLLILWYAYSVAFCLIDYSDYGNVHGVYFDTRIYGYIGILISVVVAGIVVSRLFIDDMVNGDVSYENKARISTGIILAAGLAVGVCLSTVMVVELSPRYGFSVDSIVETDYESLKYTKVEKGEYVFNIFSYGDIETSDKVVVAEVVEKGLINHKIDLSLAKYKVYNEADELVATICEYESDGTNIYVYDWAGTRYLTTESNKDDVTGNTVVVNGETIDLEYYTLFEYEGDIETFEIPGLKLRIE